MAVYTGTGDDDVIDGGAEDDTITGSFGTDSISGGGGNDNIDGGRGGFVDTANYSGNRAGYTLTINANGFIVDDSNAIDGDEGTDTLHDVERIEFADGSYRVHWLQDAYMNPIPDGLWVRYATHAGATAVALQGGSYAGTWTVESSDFLGIQFFGPHGLPGAHHFTTVSDATSFGAGPDGGVVMIRGENDAADGYDINLVLISTDGNAATPVVVSTDATGEVENTSVAMLADGRYVVTWTDRDADRDGDVWGQLLDGEGNLIGSAFQVDTGLTDLQINKEVVALANGGFEVRFENYNGMEGNQHYNVQRYDAEGDLDGPLRGANNLPWEHESLPNGRFVATAVSTTGISLWHYNTFGNYVGATNANEDNAAGVEERPSITVLRDGGFVVVWHFREGDDTRWDIHGRRFNADGDAIGGEFRVNQGQDDSCRLAEVVAMDDGGFLVSWVSGTWPEALVQRYDATGTLMRATIEGDANNNLMSVEGGGVYFKGGLGDDTYVLDELGEYAVELASEGTDEIQIGASYTLSANFENLRLLGNGAFNGTGNAANNVITGNAAANILNGGAGADRLVGGGGNDTYVVNVSDDVVVEGFNQGTDLVRSWATYTLSGSVENLVLFGATDINGTGNALANNITGNTGANVLNGGAGADRMTGGLGNDSYFIDQAGDTIVELVGQGTDTVNASFNYTLLANFENLALLGTAQQGTGNAASNVITGNASANILSGLDGNDTINGGAGNDQMFGGVGSDIYFVDSAGDTVVEDAGAGTDEVRSAVSFTLSSTVELLTLTGTAAINGTGNAFNNTIRGNDGNNQLDGGVGADTLIGGLGNDRYIVDSLGDILVETAGQGNDQVLSLITLTLGADLENLVLTGNTATNGFGNALNNALTGNVAANRLNGGAGDDMLNGAGGNDILTGAVGLDRFAFTTALGSSNVDTIVDYSIAQDTIVLENAIFARLTTTGALDAGYFRSGAGVTTAADANDFIIYNTTTGALYYDADGNGVQAARQFATLTGSPDALNAAEFVIV